MLSDMTVLDISKVNCQEISPLDLLTGVPPVVIPSGTKWARIVLSGSTTGYYHNGNEFPAMIISDGVLYAERNGVIIVPCQYELYMTISPKIYDLAIGDEVLRIIWQSGYVSFHAEHPEPHVKILKK